MWGVCFGVSFLFVGLPIIIAGIMFGSAMAGLGDMKSNPTNPKMMKDMDKMMKDMDKMNKDMPKDMDKAFDKAFEEMKKQQGNK
jgi:hypothetical protein